MIAGYDGSPQGDDALALAALLAGESGRVVAARVFPAEPRLLPGPALEHYRSRQAKERSPLIAQLREAAAAVGADSEQPLSRSPAAGLHDLAAELEADLVVVGSSQRDDTASVLVGGTGERLLHGSPCAVALAPQGFREREQRMRVVGVGYDGSPESDVALDEAIALAEAHEATMRIFTVFSPTDPQLDPGRRAFLQEASRAAEERAPEKLRAAVSTLVGDPASILREEAEKGLDLLAIGSRGFGPLQRTFSGSLAAALMHGGLPCPLLVSPRGAHPPSELERAEP